MSSIWNYSFSSIVFNLIINEMERSDKQILMRFSSVFFPYPISTTQQMPFYMHEKQAKTQRKYTQPKRITYITGNWSIFDGKTKIPNFVQSSSRFRIVYFLLHFVLLSFCWWFFFFFFGSFVLVLCCTVQILCLMVIAQSNRIELGEHKTM